MSKQRWFLVAAAAALSSVAGCYKTPKPNCTFSCGMGGACPTDYMCGPDDVCHLLVGGSLAPCAQSFDDAAVADAPAIDATTIDGPVIDSSPADAHPDGAPDGAPDSNMCPALAIMDDGTQGAGGQDLVISLVQPAASGKIELYNTTGADIVLSGKTYDLVSGSTTISLAASGVTVKSHGYATITSTFGDLSAGGEVALYHAATHLPADIDAFVCWDTDAGSIEADAVTANKWVGGCTANPSGTAVERKNNVKGTGAADYDATSSRTPRDCP